MKMTSTRIIRMLILTFIIYAYIIKCTLAYERKCHNFYPVRKQICNSTNYNGTGDDGKFINITCNICKDPGKTYLLTICNTTEFHTSIEDILSVVPASVHYLLINLDNIWNGFLPLKPLAINISGIARLRHLRHFQISDNKYQYFQFYPLAFNLSVFDKLTKLTTLRIRIPVIDNQKYTIGDMIEKLPHLEFLDFSYTRGLGTKTVEDILKKLNTDIKYLCIRKVQLPGAIGYASDFSNILWNDKTLNLKFDSLEELDISDNTIARITPGITKVFPNIKLIDLSGNALLDNRNMAFFVELLLHPTLELFNANYQGCDSQPSDYVPSSDISSELKTHERIKIPKVISPNEMIKTCNDESKDHLKEIQKNFLVNCANVVGSGNISYIFNSSEDTCRFVKCILPSYFTDLSCESDTFIPQASDIFNYTCMLYIKIPLGENLMKIQFSHVHLEQASTIGAIFSGHLCLGVNNSLQSVNVSDNDIWMESSQLDKAVSSVTGTWNFNKLKEIGFSNNKAVLSFNSPVTGTISSLQKLNLSGNYLDIREFCKVTPNVEVLDFQASHMTKIHPKALNNCRKLKRLYLGYNRLDVASLVNLNFNATPNLKHLDLRGCGIKMFPSEFTKKIDECKNLTINLLYNPLLCNCTSKEFVRWIQNKAKSRTLVNYSRYLCTGPRGLIYIHAINNTASFWATCYSDIWQIIIISVTSTIGMIALIALICITYKLRWRLKYLFYRLQQKCNLSCRKMGSETYIWRYDAFVSYSAEDRFWVHDTFMKTLEETYGFRLCIHYRDFPVGGDIAETISEKMSESREIIIIISDIAIRSEWCQFELDEALLQAHRRSIKMIVIKLGKINSKLLNTKVAHILDNHTFLEWSENSKCQNKHKLFWNTLVAQLYNDPYGECMCCCTYGARSLGYKDIIDPVDCEAIPDEDVDQLSDFPSEVHECRKRAMRFKKKVKQAKNFRQTLESVLHEDDLPHWAYGPTPWPIEQLLEDDKEKINDQINKHASERIKLLIECLTQKQTALNELHEKELNDFERGKQQYLCGASQ